MVPRNRVLAQIAAQDPARLRTRVVPAKKPGRGGKVRPRNSNRLAKEALS